MFRIVVATCLLFLAASLLPRAESSARTRPASDDAVISIDQIQPGMKGVAYTIFSGDKIEPMDLEVIGILHNALGPKQDVILVQMHGEKVEHSGVVAGMSGSPVYFNGKLAGALSLKLGVFTEGSHRRSDADRQYSRYSECPARNPGNFARDSHQRRRRGVCHPNFVTAGTFAARAIRRGKFFAAD